MSFTSLIGTIVITYIIVRIVVGIYNVFIRTNDLSSFKVTDGSSWALVTGSTGGIGEAFADELADRGFNILLLSRSNDKLRQTAERITREKKVQCDVFAVDCTAAGSSPATAEADTQADVYRRIEQWIGTRSVTILINNVGVGTEVPTPFDEEKYSDIVNIINVNVTFTTRLTQVLVPILTRQKRSAIVNLSSLSGLTPIPLLSLYAGTKAFNLSFSRSLGGELRSRGVSVTAVTPGFVATPLAGTKRTSLMVCSAQLCARRSLDGIGRSHVNPYWAHALLAEIVSVLPAETAERWAYAELLRTRKRLLGKRKKIEAAKAAQK